VRFMYSSALDVWGCRHYCPVVMAVTATEVDAVTVSATATATVWQLTMTVDVSYRYYCPVVMPSGGGGTLDFFCPGQDIKSTPVPRKQ
jgi:hypothetical protein